MWPVFFMFDPMYQVSQLFVYPVKGMAGISLNKAVIGKGGFLWDRNWMLVDENLEFISQRNLPQLALCKLSMDQECVQISYLDKVLHFNKNETVGLPMAVRVWDDFPMALQVNISLDEALSECFGKKVMLVKIIEQSRILPSQYSETNTAVSFADAFPFLLIGEASLQDLNHRLTEKIDINRFRPNIVFSGGEAFVEDTFQEFMIGSNRMKMAKPCARCTVTTINQETAEAGKEPLKTLATYRAFDHKIMFGVNVFALNETGSISIGDAVLPVT